MLRSAWFLASRDVRYLLRRRETLVWTFVMPIIFFYFIGTVTGGFGGGGARKAPILLSVGEEAGFLAGEIERRLEEGDFAVVRSAEEGKAPSRVLEIPPRFTDDVLAGRETPVRFEGGKEGVSGDYDRLRVSRAVYTVLADLIATSMTEETSSAESFARLAETPRALKLEVVSAGRRKKIPTGYEQTIPGTMVMFTLIVLLTSGAVLLVVERRQGLLRRLASTPILRGEIVLGKWAGRLALGIVQMGFAMLAGRFLFGMDWGPDLAMVCVVLLAWAAFVASLGLLLGNLARSEGQAVAIGVLSSNVLAALGGCWWPIEVTPGWMQKLSHFLPTGWAMDALHRLVSFRAGAASAVPHVLGMAVGAVILLWLAGRLFRFDERAS
jgi:ABC-2 type transport system permease protein